MVYLLVTKKGFQPLFFNQAKVQKNTVNVPNTLIYNENLWSKAPFLESFSNTLPPLAKYYSNILLNSSIETTLLFKVALAFSAAASLLSAARFTKFSTVSCFFSISFA